MYINKLTEYTNTNAGNVSFNAFIFIGFSFLFYLICECDISFRERASSYYQVKRVWESQWKGFIWHRDYVDC
jgi:hypothetical protein